MLARRCAPLAAALRALRPLPAPPPHAATLAVAARSLALRGAAPSALQGGALRVGVMSPEASAARRVATLTRHVAPFHAAAPWRHGAPGAPRRRDEAAPPDDGEAPSGGASPLRRVATAAASAAAAVAATEAPEAALSVGDIKTLLEAAGVDYRDCFEKRELAERLRSARNTLPAGAAARLDALLARSPTAAAAAAAAPSSALDELFMDEANTVSLFKRCVPSVVHIRTSAVARAPFSQDATEIPQGAGTGIVWDGDGHIITNFHVIKEAQRAKVTLADNSTWEATLLGFDQDKDLAVLKIADPATGRAPPGLRPIALGSSAGLQVGQRSFAIGNPFGLDQTLTTGVVSGVGRDIRSITGRTIRDVVQTDAAINPGNSGGPLLDSRGRLIGVNTVIYSPSGASAGVGFAIPVDTVRRVVNMLIRNRGVVVRAGLGVRCAADAQARQLGLPGVLVIDVSPGSAAARAGVRGTARSERDGALVLGDVITAVGAAKTAAVEDLLAAVEEREPGDTVDVTLLRDGRTRTVKVTLQRLTDQR